jgi:hypothetical protein
MSPRDTKIIKIYRDEGEELASLRRRLTKVRGKQASYADVVSYLLRFHKMMRPNGRCDDQ